MTCFWDGILSQLTIKDFDPYLKKKPNNNNFVEFLQKHNMKTDKVVWNNQRLTTKQLEENFTHIKEFHVDSIHNGYFCSTFEPFLFLVCQLFQLNIDHCFCHNTMEYRIDNNKRLLNFKSNKSHFS
tara:strand:- start:2675 stop:3052 length:378 start_codon:yes stop_codon:yes gene_type:complete